MKVFAVFVMYTLLSAYGLYKIKLSADYFDADFIVGFACYFSGFVIWFYILKITPLTIAFPVAAGALIIVTTLFGVVLLNEAVNMYKIFGALFIMAGIVLMSLGGRLEI